MIIQLMVVNTIFAMISAYLVYYFLKSNFNLKFTHTRLIVFAVGFSVPNGIISTLCIKYLPNNLQFLRSIFILVLSIITIKYILRTSLGKAILSFCSFMIVVLLSSFFAPLILTLITDVNITPDVLSNDIFLYIVMNTLVYLFASLLIVFIPFAKITQIKNLKPVAFLLLNTLLMLISITGITYFVSFNVITFSTTFILSLIYLATSTWYINNYHKYEMKIEEQRQQAFYNESLGQVIHDLRRFKHDQANHLTVISAMIKMKKYDQVTSYINEIFNTTESTIDTSICDIKNAGLFGLISSKKDYAQKAGIKFNLKATGEIDSIPNVKISELCEIIGIYLDNAIEAASTSDRKEVEMILESEEGNISITINNSCGAEPDLNCIKLDGYSTKGTNRGHGLSIVEKILSKYDSMLNTINFDKENMLFTQDLQIKKGI